jgi:hypothetical protein
MRALWQFGARVQSGTDGALCGLEAVEDPPSSSPGVCQNLISVCVGHGGRTVGVRSWAERSRR